jgi:hypothetical protein
MRKQYPGAFAPGYCFLYVLAPTELAAEEAARFCSEIAQKLRPPPEKLCPLEEEE